MARITDELIIRGNRIKNRIAMAPLVTFSFQGDNGLYFGRQHIEHYKARAEGGAGLIIFQGTSVSGALNSTEKWLEGNTAVMREIVRAIHWHGAAVIIQLSCGNMNVNELTAEEIHTLQAEMIQAAATACESGFDGAEYYFVHGGTMCRFLDSSYNRRTDRYGGSAENRTRLLLDILPEIRRSTNDRFIVGVRLGEYLPESRDGIETAQAFEKGGVDLLHVSYAMKPPEGPVPEGFICGPMVYSGCRIKNQVGIPVIAVGGIRTGEQVRFLIENDYVELAAVGRGMLADPEFANNVIYGRPINMCHDCAECFWFTDHAKCPARK